MMMFELQPALDMIKEFEGFSAMAYRDGGGVLTIGYGTTYHIQEGQIITKPEAERLVIDDMLKNIVPAISQLVQVGLSDNEKCALIDFVYNCGAGALGGSTLLRKLNSGALKSDVASEFLRWVHDARGVIEPGLVTRRQREQDLFLTPIAKATV
jgi:lysozyme